MADTNLSRRAILGRGAILAVAVAAPAVAATPAGRFKAAVAAYWDVVARLDACDAGNERQMLRLATAQTRALDAVIDCPSPDMPGLSDKMRVAVHYHTGFPMDEERVAAIADDVARMAAA